MRKGLIIRDRSSQKNYCSFRCVFKVFVGFNVVQVAEVVVPTTCTVCGKLVRPAQEQPGLQLAG